MSTTVSFSIYERNEPNQTKPTPTRQTHCDAPKFSVHALLLVVVAGSGIKIFIPSRTQRCLLCPVLSHWDAATATAATATRCRTVRSACPFKLGLEENEGTTRTFQNLICAPCDQHFLAKLICCHLLLLFSVPNVFEIPRLASSERHHLVVCFAAVTAVAGTPKEFLDFCQGQALGFRQLPKEPHPPQKGHRPVHTKGSVGGQSPRAAQGQKGGADHQVADPVGSRRQTDGHGPELQGINLGIDGPGHAPHANAKG
mmetsp:Transcript_21538/g.47007  ORF Transcript_21538/g.47007 Transcript_21538/m.47007 type:complete len:256 (+) Transcript_21538:169-936(+)